MVDASTTREAPDAAEERDLLDLRALEHYLVKELPHGPAGPLTARLIAGGRSNPTYDVSDGSRHWILRRPPYGEILQSAHDMSREARVMGALHGSAVPVPMVVAHCQDAEVLGAPFYVMDMLEGRTYRTHEDTGTLSVEQRRALTESMVTTLVALHSIDPADVGLADWGRPEGYLQRQVSRWGRQWHEIKTSERSEVDELVERLTRSMPPLRFPGIVHGDFKIDNLMVDHDDPSRILGLLDWEMSTLGDTLADLGVLISFWDEVGRLHNPITAGATAHEGFPSADEVVALYADRRGIDVDDLEWYIVFADFKIAVILEQIHHRHLQGTTVGDWFDDIGDMVGPLLTRARDRADRAGL
ncbi:phosphotransferase family protein [Nocardioides alcanivorans]|uniref:phosphotransferase family protein n=1 Tax=Nocardioides alcanivorans TaxID=2897352 RepID=UPI001F169E07|nr:phosphotransferase family protein [Nocardioides alcanivorans]